MAENKVRDELSRLIDLGNKILYVGIYANGNQDFDDETKKYLKELSQEIKGFKKEYQIWYARAFRTVRTFSPERLDEFEEIYRGKKNMKQLNYVDAGITHYLQGIVSTRIGSEDQDYFGKFTNGLERQIYILEGIRENVDEILYNLESEIHFAIFKSEIDIARDFKKHGQLRAAGAITGVVIEEHLKLIAYNSNIK